MHTARRALLLVVALFAAATITSCAAGPRGPVGAITVHTTDTTASETVTVSVVDLGGHTVRQATGPGVHWSAAFADVPVGRYRVRVLIASPASHGPGGVATSQTVLVQSPVVIGVEAGTHTVLSFDGQDWTAVQ